MHLRCEVGLLNGGYLSLLCVVERILDCIRKNAQCGIISGICYDLHFHGSLLSQALVVAKGRHNETPNESKGASTDDLNNSGNKSVETKFQ